MRHENRIGSGLGRTFLLLAFGVAGATTLGGLGCKAKETIVEDDFNFDGTCVNCHVGLEAKQVHGTYKLRCIDCHGGNDQVEDVPDNAFEDENIFRDPDLIVQSHVRPKDGLARFFYANGIDDDFDGTVDEGPTFEDDGTISDFGEIAEPGLHGEGMGLFLDSELNRDLNYTRWLNPGDLRVATIGCGSKNAAALTNDTGGCHQSVIETNRRSVMVNNSAVINGAYYGNESWRATFQEARGNSEDPRKGAFGYMLDYVGADGCIDENGAADDATGRTQPFFDSACLEALAAENDPQAVAGAPGNTASNINEDDLPDFEITQGSSERHPDTDGETTVAHVGGRDSRFPEWGGKPLVDPEASIELMQPVPLEDLADFGLATVPDPVDLILRGFRAYFPLNYPGSIVNQNFTFGTSILPEIAEIKTSNPFGRGHSAGCTSCHMAYNYDGSRNAQKVPRIQDGELVFDEVVDPTTKHREFDAENEDIIQIDGEDRLVGIAVTTAERELTGREDQQRMYSANHEMTTQITTEQCGLCHAFVTRINMVYTGTAEEEQRDALARHKAIEFDTFRGTRVAIHDSFIREELIDGEPKLIVPDGQEIVELAEQRDKELLEQGLLPGFGGCAPFTFTEDCNNNGELDTELTLQKVDENGKVLAEVTISEDLNGNNTLDLIDRVPRNFSQDGRQVRYIYGGPNQSTRMMDIHYEKGMHCIDCHMLQDSHGDGHLYGTNHEIIEIECEDCHGSFEQQASLFTSGANGGNDLTKAFDNDGRPFFERKNGKVIQRSRVTPGLAWDVPQLPQFLDADDPEFNDRTTFAHSAFHLPPAPEAGQFQIGSQFEDEPGKSPLVSGKLECYSCHNSWVLNCMGCHDNANFGDNIKPALNADGTVDLVAGENEVWYNNSNQYTGVGGSTNFQLLAFMRSPFVLATAAAADAQRIAPFRSSMIVHVNVTNVDGNALFQNMNFTTFQDLDANSGRTNVATSGSAMNQTMPHTVRPEEVRSCESCHALVNQDGAVRNDHILGEVFGVGAGRYPILGDFATVAGTGGIEMYDFKQENELAGSAGVSRFPGLILNGGDRVAANIEPVFGAGDLATDAVFIRNFNKTPAAAGATQPPTLRDLMVTAVDDGDNTGSVVISDVTIRGNPGATRPNLGDGAAVFVLDLPDGPANALAHLGPDVSDPYVYVANGAAGLTVVELQDAPIAGQNTAEVLDTVAIPGDLTATEVITAGDVAYVGTAEGTIETFDLADPEEPNHVASIDVGAQVNGLAMGGAFHMWIATPEGLGAVSIENPLEPTEIDGADDVILLADIDINELSVSAGKAYLAAGAQVLEVDIVTKSNEPTIIQDLVEVQGGGEVVDAQDAVVVVLPGQTWVLVADANGDLVGLKLDNTQSIREKCAPDPVANGCGLDMDFRDYTILGRDPSFDPNADDFFADDPSGQPVFRITSDIVNAGRRIVRPMYWEKLNTQTGRRYRDSFMPGSGTLSLEVMQRMWNFQLCEAEGTEDLNGNGLGQLGLADENFFNTGNCEPLGLVEGNNPPDEEEASARNGECTVDPNKPWWQAISCGSKGGAKKVARTKK